MKRLVQSWTCFGTRRKEVHLLATNVIADVGKHGNGRFVLWTAFQPAVNKWQSIIFNRIILWKSQGKYIFVGYHSRLRVFAGLLDCGAVESNVLVITMIAQIAFAHSHVQRISAPGDDRPVIQILITFNLTAITDQIHHVMWYFCSYQVPLLVTCWRMAIIYPYRKRCGASWMSCPWVSKDSCTGRQWRWWRWTIPLARGSWRSRNRPARWHPWPHCYRTAPVHSSHRRGPFPARKNKRDDFVTGILCRQTPLVEVKK